jgi:hypothetical protein
MNIGTTSQVVPSPASLYGNQGSRCPFLFSSLKPATKAEVSKKPPRQRSGGGGVGRVFMRRGGTGCESSRASRILSQAGEPSVLRSPARGSSMAERSAKSLPRSQVVSKVCQLSRCPWFCSGSSSICSHSGTAVSASCGRSIRLGLMVLREFIRTIYHEVEIYESGAFERGQC